MEALPCRTSLEVKPGARSRLSIGLRLGLRDALGVVLFACGLAGGLTAAPAVLSSDALARHVARFNAQEDEPIVNLVPNSEAAAWLHARIPLFECPDAEVEEIYFFRWW